MRKLFEKMNQNSTKLAVFNAVRQHKKATASDVECEVQSSKPTILKYLDELASESPIGSNGMMIVPYFQGGRRSPNEK